MKKGWLVGLGMALIVATSTRLARADVLLIVNGTTIGPIQPGWVDEETYRECVSRQPAEIQDKLERGFWAPANDGPFPCRPLRGRNEIVAETCERAMREIGATTDRTVLCVPAPSGLKR